MHTPNSAEAIRARSRRLRSVVTVMVFGLGALLAMERFSAAAISGWRGGGWEWLAAQGAAAVPEVVYLLALWWVRQALAAFAAGELFTPAVARTLHRVGLTLAIPVEYGKQSQRSPISEIRTTEYLICMSRAASSTMSPSFKRRGRHVQINQTDQTPAWP